MNGEGIWTGRFWVASAERAIKSAAQGILVVWLGDAGIAGGKVASLIDFDPSTAAYAAGGMAVASLLMSIVSAPISHSRGSTGPSLTKAETLTPDPPVPAPPPYPGV